MIKPSVTTNEYQFKTVADNQSIFRLKYGVNFWVWDLKTPISSNQISDYMDQYHVNSGHATLLGMKTFISLFKDGNIREGSYISQVGTLVINGSVKTYVGYQKNIDGTYKYLLTEGKLVTTKALSGAQKSTNDYAIEASYYESNVDFVWIDSKHFSINYDSKNDNSHVKTLVTMKSVHSKDDFDAMNAYYKADFNNSTVELRTIENVQKFLNWALN